MITAIGTTDDGKVWVSILAEADSEGTIKRGQKFQLIEEMSFDDRSFEEKKETKQEVKVPIQPAEQQ